MEWKELEDVEKINEGNFGVVYSCKYKGEVVAVKVYKPGNEKYEQVLKNALEIAKHIKHKNLIVCTNYFYDNIGNELHLISVLEYVDGIHLNKVERVEDKMQTYLPQIVLALKYLHHNNVVHRDIKPENILVDLKNDNVKIIDYDFLRRSKDGLFDYHGRCGSFYYMAYELFLEEKFTCKVDLWSLGVTLYYCLRKRMPFEAKNKEDLRIIVLSDYLPSFNKISILYRDIMQGLLIRDVEKRISLKEIQNLLKVVKS